MRKSLPSDLPIVTKVGFTGSRYGMTSAQMQSVEKELSKMRVLGTGRIFRHGCCQGADEQATEIALEHNYKVIGHPPKDQSWFSEIAADNCHDLVPPKGFLSRNQDIVNLSWDIIAAPNSYTSEGGGTWATIEYAKRLNKRLLILFPDGSEARTGPNLWDLAVGPLKL